MTDPVTLRDRANVPCVTLPTCRQQPTDAELRRLRAAQNELARLAWERGPVEKDEPSDNGAARMAAAVREE